MKARSQPTWAVHSEPSTDEWVDWFLSNSREGQVEIAAMALGAFRDINQCQMSAPGCCWIDR